MEYLFDLWSLPAHTDSNEPNFFHLDFVGEPFSVFTCCFFVINSILFAKSRWKKVESQNLELICELCLKFCSF